MGDAVVRNDEAVELHERLDELWARHLDCLDRYQKAQDSLRRLVAAGHFSLAQANFKSSNRRPYGRDYYDGRMKTSKHVVISEGAGNDVIRHLVFKQTSIARRQDPKEGKDPGLEPKQQPSPPSTPNLDSPDNDHPGNETSSEEQDEKSEPAAKTLEPSQDPLRWFGILIPRELRSAQASFSAAVEGPLVEAANAVRGMREIEAEIRKTRKAIAKAEKGATSKTSTG